METINGRITNISSVSGYQGQFGYVYTFQMTIQTPDGAYKTGIIGSKSQVYPLSDGSPITVEVTNHQGEIRFKKFDPQYGQPSSQQAPQAAPVAPQSPSAPPPISNDQREMRIVRGNALNAVLSAADIPLDQIGNYLLTSVQFILGGEWKLEPSYQRGQPSEPILEDNPDSY